MIIMQSGSTLPEHDYCRRFADVTSRGRGWNGCTQAIRTGFEKVFEKVFKTLHNQQYISFFDFFFSVNIKREKSIERKKICIKSKVSKHKKKILENFSMLGKVCSGVVFQCTNHATTILMCKLLYINITSTIQQQSFFLK